MNLAVIYARYSPRPTEDTEQESILAIEDHRSLMLQIEVCEAYASLHKLDVVSTIKDAETSARKTKLHERTGGQELLAFIEEGVRHIIIAKLDRMFRHIDGRLQMDEWAARGISLHVANQDGQSINCGTAMGRMFAGVCLLFAEYEPAIIAERTSAGMQRLQREGKAMSRLPPFGFRREGKLLVPDDKEQEVIPLVLELHAEEWSLQEIATYLDNSDYKPRGSRWHKSTVRAIIQNAASSSPPSASSVPESKLG